MSDVDVVRRTRALLETLSERERSAAVNRLPDDWPEGVWRAFREAGLCETVDITPPGGEPRTRQRLHPAALAALAELRR
ncbi:hypothetical protein [Kineococcus terrestris]|uniref:hypothetical protein n=1 Tax=Kineococcus terrestris TaxID=2044856 RepID=UPI0034DB04FC